MKKSTLLIIFVLLALFSLGVARGTAPDRYVSPWLTLQPGESVALTHGLGSRPLIVQLWAAYNPNDLNNATLWTEIPSHSLTIYAVNLTTLSVTNNALDPWTIQVVAEK